MAVTIRRRLLLAILVLYVATYVSHSIPVDWAMTDDRSPTSMDTVTDSRKPDTSFSSRLPSQKSGSSNELQCALRVLNALQNVCGTDKSNVTPPRRHQSPTNIAESATEEMINGIREGCQSPLGVLSRVCSVSFGIGFPRISSSNYDLLNARGRRKLDGAGLNDSRRNNNDILSGFLAARGRRNEVSSQPREPRDRKGADREADFLSNGFFAARG